MSNDSEIIVVYGTADSGHLEHKEALQKAFGCTSIFEGDFDPRYAEPEQYPVLVLMTVNDSTKGLQFSRVVPRRSAIHADLAMRILKDSVSHTIGKLFGESK